MNPIASVQNDLLTATLCRRDWLLATTGILLGAGALDAAADQEAPLKKNLNLGVMSNVYSHLPLEQAVAKIKAEGFGCVVTDFAFADVRFDPLRPDWPAVEKIRTCLARHGIRIVGLYGYTNIVDPHPAKRARGLKKDRVPAGQRKASGLRKRFHGNRHAQSAVGMAHFAGKRHGRGLSEMPGGRGKAGPAGGEDPAPSFPSSPIGRTSSTR